MNTIYTVAIGTKLYQNEMRARWRRAGGRCFPRLFIGHPLP